MLHFLVQMIFVALWFSAAAYVYGMNDFRYVGTMDSIGQGRLPVWKTPVAIMMGIKVFAILWFLAFVNTKLVYITMVSACTYYFTSNEKDEGTASVITGFKWGYGVNIGSIAYASLV